MYERNAKLKRQKKYINILTQHISSHKNILSNFMMRAIFVDIKYCVNLIFKFCEMTKRIAEISMHQKVAEYPNTLQIKSNEILNELSEGENRLRNLFNQFSFALNWFKN